MRLFLDVSDTHNSGNLTGIQRVVRSLARSFSDLEVEQGFEFFLLRSDPSDPKSYNDLSRQEFFSRKPSYVMPVSSQILFESKDYLFVQKIWKMLKKIDFLNFLSSTFFSKLKNKLANTLFQIKAAEATSGKNTQVEFRPGDVLFLADAFWAAPHTTLISASEAKKQGARILLLLNDIFPVSHPEYVEFNNRTTFNKMLPEALDLADLLIFPSHYTKNQLGLMFPNQKEIPTTTIKYGVERTETAILYENLERIPNSIVMIGTIEPRKNYSLVLKWFLDSAPTGTVVTIIGKNGWMNETVVSALRRESRKKQGLTWIKNASDEDLSYEMKRHEIGIMASHAEGLGLPVLEYSANGLKLVLSDIPVFREVAGDAGHYFDRYSVESLDRAINAAWAQKEVRTIPEVSWRDTALEVLGFLNEKRDR
jgi:glycosyltransferase involved in cell wall biosynthesis